MNIKENRTVGYVIIAVIYLLGSVLGILVYNLLNFSIWLNVLIADVIATTFVYLFSLAFDNASVYDPYWSVQPIVIVVCLAISYPMSVSKLLPLIAICFWGVRLTANWAYTFHSFKYQDWRYLMLKEKTGKLYPVINYLGIHMFPTLVVYACTLPVIFTFTLNFNISVASVLFFALSICATVCQGIADIQMHKFRKNRITTFIRTGLWKYSRHPNYLGEILMWWGIALAFVFAVPSMWYLSVGALLNNLMFIIVSIPMADKKQSKKEGFEEYKKQTRMLIPLRKVG